MEKRMKLYVVTGFLGAGKTTLLHSIAGNSGDRKIGIIQTEPRDPHSGKGGEVRIAEIINGSISSSLSDLSFTKALGEMASKGFDYLFTESSGLTDPRDLRETVNASRIVSGKELDYMGIICLVDALNFMDEKEELETVVNQVKQCNLAVVTKTDLVSQETLDEVTGEIRKINPVCLITYARCGETDLDFLNTDLTVNSHEPQESAESGSSQLPYSVRIEFERKIPMNDLINFLSDIKKETYRIKGCADISETGWNTVDVVGLKTDFKETENCSSSYLVIVSKKGSGIVKSLETAWKENITIPMKIKDQY